MSAETRLHDSETSAPDERAPRPAGLFQRLGARFLREAPADPRPGMLLERPITDAAQFEALQQDAAQGVLRLDKIGAGEAVLVHFKRYGDYGHERRLLLERVMPQDRSILFRVTGDDQEGIYEKTNPHLEPFAEGAIAYFDALEPDGRLLDDELRYSAGFSFGQLGLGPNLSDYKLYQASVAHDGVVHELFQHPERATTIFRG